MSYEVEMIQFAKEGEKAFNEREKLFAHNAKIDQMPAHNSMIQIDAKYEMNRYTTELTKRIKRRLRFLGSDYKSVFKNDSAIENFVNNVLSIKDGSETDKMLYSIGIIETITDILNEGC